MYFDLSQPSKLFLKFTNSMKDAYLNATIIVNQDL